MWRLSCPGGGSGFGGLTMSDEGGLGGEDGFWPGAANFSSKGRIFSAGAATSSSSVCPRCCRRSHFRQDLVLRFPIAALFYCLRSLPPIPPRERLPKT